MNKYSFIIIEGDKMREKDPEKIQKIYNATLELVMEEGIDAINISKIAKKSKVASGTLYIYFENGIRILFTFRITTECECRRN